MDFDKTIGGYLENTEWKGRTDIGCLLNGCRQMYAATQDERYQKFILQYVEKMTEEWENAFSKTDVTKKINAGSDLHGFLHMKRPVRRSTKSILKE